MKEDGRFSGTCQWRKIGLASHSFKVRGKSPIHHWTWEVNVLDPFFKKQTLPLCINRFRNHQSHIHVLFVHRPEQMHTVAHSSIP
jgi:hypothetical protein